MKLPEMKYIPMKRKIHCIGLKVDQVVQMKGPVTFKRVIETTL